MSAAAPLLVEAVHKRYGDREVLKDIGLTLAPGEIFGLIGLNGAGKTTLIKIILDLAKADRGMVRMFGLPATDLKARRRLSYLPEKFQPSRYLRGMEYLALSLAYYGKSLDAASACAEAGKLDLDAGVLSARVGSYSKGMGQKLGLLGAFLIDADLLLLDEPMSGLDPRARIRLKEKLIEARRLGKTVFFSSHILSDIDDICDRIGVIHDGRLFFTGAPAQFKETYREPVLERAFLKSISSPA